MTTPDEAPQASEEPQSGTGLADSAVSPRSLLRLSTFFAAIYFVQGTSSPESGLAHQPILFLLKDDLRLSASGAASFLAIMSLAWNIKPLYGLTSDFVPLFGYRRKSYLLVTTGLATLVWLILALLPGHPYERTLVLLMICSFGFAFSDVLCDAVMVETGKLFGWTGRFQAIQWGAINVASLLSGIGGGWLSEYASHRTAFLVVALFPAISLTITATCLRDRRTGFDRRVLGETAGAIRAGLGSRPLWVAAGFIFLWNFSPSFGTPLQYHMVDTLGFSKIFLGTLDTLGSAGAIVGATLFGAWCRRLRLKTLLNVSVGIGVVSTLAYWWLAGWWSAIVLTIGTGLISMIASLATFDLAARSCPDRAEGTFFAALMSVANIGTTWSGFLGGKLYDWVGMWWLILISAVATAVCWLVVPYVQVKVGETSEKV